MNVVQNFPISLYTIGKQGIFLSYFIFLCTEEYNGSIFLGTKTEECIVN
jgi:hypothetical protein